ncbi:MAG: 50S ribosomal protein L5 [Deltaproteobacteria bacterium]|nr:50S ribosomal protein L5 [Deltaproteobacteria bacterium]
MAENEKKKGAEGGGEGKQPKKDKTPKAQASKAQAKGGKKEAAPKETAEAGQVYKRTSPPRLKVMYEKDVVPRLMKEFSYKNPMQVPRLTKITLNMGLGEAVANPKILDSAVEELRTISGQQPVVTRAKKAIANFKLRQGLKIGAMVTLRRERMWEFLDRLANLALPRVRDFKGISPRAFDGRGNYSLGIKEQIIFPEINYDKIDKIKGLNVSIVTTARTDEEGRALLRYLGLPFRQ